MRAALGAEQVAVEQATGPTAAHAAASACARGRPPPAGQQAGQETVSPAASADGMRRTVSDPGRWRDEPRERAASFTAS